MADARFSNNRSSLMYDFTQDVASRGFEGELATALLKISPPDDKVALAVRNVIKGATSVRTFERINRDLFVMYSMNCTSNADVRMFREGLRQGLDSVKGLDSYELHCYTKLPEDDD